MRIQEDAFGVGKADTMLPEVRLGLAGIPGHTHVCMICILLRDVNDRVWTVQHVLCRYFDGGVEIGSSEAPSRRDRTLARTRDR